jgi:hypothetical protein
MLSPFFRPWTTSVVLFGILWKRVFLELRRYRRQFEVENLSLEKCGELLSPRNSYSYQPLRDQTKKEIRLIELQPGHYFQPIQIAFRHTSLKDPKPSSYEAISYCWGDTPTHYPIFYNSDSILWATRNLSEALRRLRFPDKTRLLWADAISIDQTDLQEKSCQVKMMGDVYCDAKRVLIWLGEEADESHLVLDFVHKLRRTSALMKEAGIVGKLASLSIEQRRAVNAPSDLDLVLGGWAMHSVMARPWFKRVWIIQEFLLAREAVLFCGKWEIAWTDFWEAFRIGMDFDIFNYGSNMPMLTPFTALGLFKPAFILGHGSTVPDLDRFAALGTFRTAFGSTRTPLSCIIRHHRDAVATQPVDHIYGLLGLALDGNDVEIDYTKSIPEVFEEAARHILRSSGNLEVLAMAGTSSGKAFNLPSWVPDWSKPGKESLLDDRMPGCTITRPEHPLDFERRKLRVLQTILVLLILLDGKHPLSR